MNRTSIGTMRYLFFGVGLVGGLILLAAGQTLIGGLLVAMGAVRIVMLVSMQRGKRSSSPQASSAMVAAVVGVKCCSASPGWSLTSLRPRSASHPTCCDVPSTAAAPSLRSWPTLAFPRNV